MSKETRSPFFVCFVLVLLASLVVGYFYTKATWPDNEIARAWNTFTPAHAQTQGQISSTSLSVSHGSPSVVGRPTLSPDFLNKVLAAAHSPAQGTGQALYDLSVHYGIDDAYALAFFKHESGYGTTGVARVTRSLGNIRCSDGYTCISGYRAYGSWQAGYADWYQLILILYIRQWHLTTPAQIIPVYAPASDHNNPPAYIADVERSVSAWRKGDVQI